MVIPVKSSDKSFFSKFKILPSVKSSIVIPVKDEEEYILKTLNSFTRQVDIFGKPLDSKEFEILVLANNCSDNSVALIKKFQQENPNLNIYLEEVTLPQKHSNIGYIRRNLMDCAYRRLKSNGNGIIMTTDGDTTVATDWISQTDLEIKNGADAVGGRILLYSDEIKNLDQSTHLLHFKDEKYQLLIAELEGKIIEYDFDPVPRHHQHFNGSFAITTDCYAKSGGVPIVEQLEDCAFFDRLQSVDAKIRHSYDVKVYTSARCVGRAQIGLSYQLNVWKNLGKNTENYYVEPCDSITERLIHKKGLMDIWKLKDQITKSEFLQKLKKISPETNYQDDLYNFFTQSLYFGEWYEKLIKSKINKDNALPVSIDKAITDLQQKIEGFQTYDFVQTSIR